MDRVQATETLVALWRAQLNTLSEEEVLHLASDGNLAKVGHGLRHVIGLMRPRPQETPAKNAAAVC